MDLRLDHPHLGRAPRPALAEDPAELLLIDAREQRTRIGDLHRLRAGGHGRGAAQVRERSVAHPVLEVAVLGREPLLSPPRLARGHGEAHRAARRIDAEPGPLVGGPQACAAEILLDGQIAGDHDLLVVRGAGHPSGLEDQRAQHQLLLGGGAGADEEALQLGARELGHALHVVRRERHRHLRLELRQVHLELARVRGVRVGAEGAHRLHRLVGFEDPVQAPEFRRHVGDREPRVGGELPDAFAAVLDRPLHGDGVPAEKAERAEDDVLAGDTERQLSPVLDGDGFRHLDPRAPQHHRHHDVRPAQPDGHRAEPAVRGGVAVRAQHQIAGPDQVPIEPGMQDGLVGVVEVTDAALLRERP